MIRKDYQILLNELISVNFNDEFIGPIEKWKAHLNSYIMDKDSMPHRAFSIFLFNS
jgi:isopentenyl-diphosphate delta-isomerase